MSIRSTLVFLYYGEFLGSHQTIYAQSGASRVMFLTGTIRKVSLLFFIDGCALHSDSSDNSRCAVLRASSKSQILEIHSNAPDPAFRDDVSHSISTFFHTHIVAAISNKIIHQNYFVGESVASRSSSKSPTIPYTYDKNSYD